MLVDTNVLFALVVETDWSDRAIRLYESDADWHSESHSLVELSNVLVRYTRNDLMTADQAHAALERAGRLTQSGLHHVHHRDALDAAFRHGVSAYDARFLVAAEYFSTRLVTEDQKLRRAAPLLTRSLADAVS